MFFGQFVWGKAVDRFSRSFSSPSQMTEWFGLEETPISSIQHVENAVAIVVFAGDSDGNVIALDARSGQHLWHVQLGAGIYSTAMTYAVNGKQFIVIPAGSAIFAFAVSQP